MTTTTTTTTASPGGGEHSDHLTTKKKEKEEEDACCVGAAGADRARYTPFHVTTPVCSTPSHHARVDHSVPRQYSLLNLRILRSSSRITILHKNKYPERIL
jgi:hypothetical protein